MCSSNAYGRLAFLRDIEVHAKFLVALPAFIVAELIIHSRMLPVARRFVERRIILLEDLPRFYRVVESAFRLRDSIPLELGLFAAVYSLGLLFWHGRFGIEEPTWYARPGGRWNLTPAGYWYVFISIPILQFILLRWYVRLSILIASNVLYHGGKLFSFKLQAGSFVGFFVLAIFGPLLMFTPQMASVRRKGLADYGLLARRYVVGFRDRWILGHSIHSEELLGTGDIQSLADLGNSYTVVQEMRLVPFSLKDVSRLAAATVAPMVPLLLLVWSPEEVIMQVLKVVF